MPRTPSYEEWESHTITHLSTIFASAIGAPKIIDVRRALSPLANVQVIYAEPRFSQCRNLIDWDSLRPKLRLLFRIHGYVRLEFGGHDELRNIWFHCTKDVPCGEGKWQRRLAAVFVVPGQSQPRSRL